jgi:subtilisin-like proprotein convertase family protein
MRFHPLKATKVFLTAIIVSMILSIATLTPTIPVGAAPSGVSPVDVIYTNLPGDPTSEVPGLPGVRFEPSTTSSTIFDRVYGSQNGNWAFLAVTDLAATEDEVLVVNNVVRAREGTTIGTVPNPLFAFDTKLGVNNDGEVVFATDTAGATTSDEYILQVDGTTVTVIANEGTATGLPTLPGTTWGAILESPAIANDGTVGFSADTVLGLPSTQDDLLVIGSTVVAQEGVTIPTGQIGTEAWENYDLGEFWTSADATDWIIQGDLLGAAATDGVVVVNGAVVIQEGVILPGSGYTETVGATGNINLHMDGGGGWMARGSNTGSGNDWVYRNSALVAELNEPIFVGATEVYSDAGFASTFFLNVGNSNGDYVIGGVTNGATTSNAVLVHNNTTLIAREGDPLDINGNGSNDDDAFINTFGNDDGYLSDAGIYYFMATIRNAAGAQTGQGFFSIDLNGGGTPTPTATPDPGPTNTPTATATNTTVPPTNTATATPSNTAVPPTNTATATPTNTAIPPTNTATATPGGGGNRFCSTTPITIPDANPTGATGTIAVGSAGTISDLNVIITGTHTWVGDIRLNLSNGTTNVTFYDQPGVPASTFGCSGDNLPGVIADDEGANGSFENSCQNATPAYTPGGSYTNNNALSAFDGANTSGTWTLTVSDLAAGDTGTIDSWCIEFGTGAGPTPTATATPTQPGQVPDINVNPTSFDETHSSAPQVTTDTMNIGNTGNATLTWTITEDDSRPFANPNPVQPRDANAPTQRLGAAGDAAISKLELGPIVGDGSFETGTPNASWEEFSTNFGTPLCDAVCGTGGGTGPRTGAWWAWFGGTTAAETGIITQSVTIPSGSAELTFWLEIPATATGTNGFLSVRMDGTEVFRAEETTTGYGTYAEVSVDVSAYADGGAHELVFFSITDAGAAVTNFFVDDVAITAQAGGQCSSPTDIPWLTVAPANGSTAGGGNTPTTLTYNSAALAIGTYTGTLCIASNDPDEALVTVPVSLTVESGPTAIDLSTFTSPMKGVTLADLATAGLLLLAGAVLVLRRK